MRSMKRWYSLVLACFFIGTNLSFAQNIKRYSGKHSLSDSIQGVANYTYLLIADSIQFSGSFRFKSDIYKINNSDKIGRLTIDGNYDKHLKSGRWQYDLGEYKIDYKDIQDLKLITTLDGVERKIICRYNQGVPDGEWEIFRNSIIQGRRQGQAISSKANFRNGTIDGTFSFDDRDGDNFISITGFFNPSGYFHKDWNLSYSYNGVSYNEYRQYRQGFLVKLIIRDSETNSTVYSIDYTEVNEKVNQLRKNEPDLEFEEGTKGFGLLFDNGYAPNDDRIKAQLIGNEILQHAFHRYSDKQSIIGLTGGSVAPEMNFTKRFKFIYPTEETSLLGNLKHRTAQLIFTLDSILAINKFVLNKQKTDSLAQAFELFKTCLAKLDIIDSTIIILQDGSFDYINRDNYFKEGIPALNQSDTLKYIFDSKPRIKLVDFGLKIDGPENLVQNLTFYFDSLENRVNGLLSYALKQIQLISQEKELEIIDAKIISLSDQVDSLYRIEARFDKYKQKDLNLKSNGKSEPDKIIPEVYVLIAIERKDDLISKYSKENEFQRKEEIGNQIISLLNGLNVIYPDLYLISGMKSTIDSAYTRFSPNPFMDRLAESRIKQHIYIAGMDKLLPFMLEDLKKSVSAEELSRKTKEILRLRTRMIELARSEDPEIEKLNIRIRRESVPERIKRLLGLTNQNGL